MLKFIDFSKSELLSDAEDCNLRSYLDDCGIPKSWFADVKFYWNFDMGLDVNGAFSVFRPDSIYLTSSFRGDLKRLVATAAHELCHRNDFYTFQMLYFIMSIPIVRNILLEDKAETLEKKANDVMKIDEAFRL